MKSWEPASPPDIAAYHEAGHCMAMLVFGDPIALATVDGGSGLVTRPERRRYRVDDEVGRQRALEYIVTCLSGPKAECRVAELPPAAIDADRRMAFAIACKLCNGD
jgi:hypothetical protein